MAYRPADEVVGDPVSGSKGRRPRVAVIGAGAGGVCMGAWLRRLGIGDFLIFEQSDGIGGTWHDNTYPGAAVDTSVPFYSFSFHPFPFSRSYCSQAEIVRYLESVVATYDLQSYFRFRTRVTRAVWDELTHSYEVLTEHGERYTFDVIVSAVGLLNHPKYPDWPGLDGFRGPKFHSSRWDHSVDIVGKRVAVVGTGSTGVQMVPALAPIVGHLYVFQRQPGWILPKFDERDFSAEERARMMRPWFRRWARLRHLLKLDKTRGTQFIEGTEWNRRSQGICQSFIETTLKDRPDLQEMVTPHYPFGGKRPVKDNDFYPALLRQNVELVPHDVKELTETEVVDSTGTKREVDVLVMCTGFQPANFLATFELVGRGGRTIHEVWNGEAEAYLGLTVAGFPNFYMLYGPNTNGAPIMFMHERQVEFVAANIRRMMRTGVTSIEVRKSVMDLFNRIIQKRLSERVPSRHPEVHNYGRASSGRDVIAWRDGMIVYSILTRITPRLSSTARRLGARPASGAATVSPLRAGRPDDEAATATSRTNGAGRGSTREGPHGSHPRSSVQEEKEADGTVRAR
jgi:cation diffusion facilitator CzcD-associated flavoprotein CzcO